MERITLTPNSRKVWIALAIVYVVWGSTYLAIRVGDRTIPPFLMASARFLVAGGVLFALARRRGDAAADPIGRRQWAAAALVGGLLLVGGNGLLVWAERRVSSSVSALLIATVPIWMAAMTAVRDRTRVVARTALGLAVGFGGTALLVRASGSAGGSIGASGIAALLAAAVSWALGSVLSSRVALPARPLVATAMEMLTGGAMLAVVALASGEVTSFHPERVALTSALGLAYLIVFGSLVAFSAYVWLLRNATTSLVSTYAYVNPVVAVLLGWAILHERVTLMMLVGAAAVVASVALVVASQHGASREAPTGAPAPEPAIEPVPEASRST